MVVKTAHYYEPKPTSLKMSYESFLVWAGDEDTHAEWVNGEVISIMPAKYVHQVIATFLDRLLGLFVTLFDLGQVLTAPFEIKLIPGYSSREPDIFFVAKANLPRLSEDRLTGPADLIVEIVSNDSVKRDRKDKLQEYCRAGVREYWIIDNRPRQQRAEFYQLNATGQYEAAPIVDGIYRSVVLPNFWLRVEWLWQESPNIWQALAEVIGAEKIAEALQKSSKNK